MLVVVPLGLTLLPTRTASPRWWFAFAVPGVVSLWLPRGAVSITLASIYLAGTLVLITLAARHFLQHKVIRPREIALYTALATPAEGRDRGRHPDRTSPHSRWSPNARRTNCSAST